MASSLRAKLFLISLALIAVCIAVGYSYASSGFASELAAQGRDAAVARATLIARAAALELGADRRPERYQALAATLAAESRVRVTFVATDGQVLGDAPQAAPPLRKLTVTPAVKNLFSGEARAPVVVRDGSVLDVFAPVPVDGGRHVVVRVSGPVEEALAARRAMERLLAAIAVLAVAAAVILSSVASELVARTARGAAQVVWRLASGDFTARSQLAARDEFSELGRALNRLARSLSRSFGELRGERDRLHGIVSGMQEGMLLLDASGRIMVVNPALREMLLLGPDAVGKTLLEAIRHAELKQLLDQARTSPEPVLREIEVGGIKPRRLLVRVTGLASQERGQIVAVFVDVTEMRRLEAVRRDFVANVSHELRTPVTAIRSAAETLQAGVPEEPQVLAQFIGIIARNAERLQDLVEDVLDLSRIESREFKLNVEPLELRVVYGQVLSLFRERADRKGIQLVNDVPSGLPRVLADRRALEHVLTNLIDNAVKYCGSGARVRVSAVELDDCVRLLVEDNGPGIEARHLPRIFERFYRVDAGRSRELGGTGLGLSIVKHLVEAMGGLVQVESTPGVGTTFSFTLKKAQPEAAKAVA